MALARQRCSTFTGACPTSGTIALFGQPITDLAPYKRARAGIGRTFQITNLFPRLSVIEHLRLCGINLVDRRFAMLKPADGYAEVERFAADALQRIGLWDKRNSEVRHFSYGHQRQLEVAIAVSLQPRLLLLDEPAAGLSPAEIGPIVATIHCLDSAMTVIIVEHDMDVALAVAERVIVFNHGELVAEGSPDGIRGDDEVQRIYLGRAGTSSLKDSYVLRRPYVASVSTSRSGNMQSAPTAPVKVMLDRGCAGAAG
jgi:branched-chain amino acid transport system ATP-binding protein